MIGTLTRARSYSDRADTPPKMLAARVEFPNSKLESGKSRAEFSRKSSVDFESRAEISGADSVGSGSRVDSGVRGSVAVDGSDFDLRLAIVFTFLGTS